MPSFKVSSLAPFSNQALLLSSRNSDVSTAISWAISMCQVSNERNIFELFLFWILEGFSSNPHHNHMKLRYPYFHYVIIHFTKYHVHNRCSINATVLKVLRETVSLHRNSRGTRHRTIIHLYSILRPCNLAQVNFSLNSCWIWQRLLTTPSYTATYFSFPFTAFL